MRVWRVSGPLVSLVVVAVVLFVWCLCVSLFHFSANHFQSWTISITDAWPRKRNSERVKGERKPFSCECHRNWLWSFVYSHSQPILHWRMRITSDSMIFLLLWGNESKSMLRHENGIWLSQYFVSSSLSACCRRSDTTSCSPISSFPDNSKRSKWIKSPETHHS